MIRTRGIVIAALISIAGLLSHATAEDAQIPPPGSAPGRDLGPGLAEAEMPARRSAQCHELRSVLDGLPELDRRIDLWVAGDAVAVQTDGVLWYVVVCASPDIRVLCVTYEGNGMQAGDRISARGAYSRRDDNHVLLDPCLASAFEGESR